MEICRRMYMYMCHMDMDDHSDVIVAYQDLKFSPCTLYVYHKRICQDYLPVLSGATSL